MKITLIVSLAVMMNAKPGRWENVYGGAGDVGSNLGSGGELDTDYSYDLNRIQSIQPRREESLRKEDDGGRNLEDSWESFCEAIDSSFNLEWYIFIIQVFAPLPLFLVRWLCYYSGVDNCLGFTRWPLATLLWGEIPCWLWASFLVSAVQCQTRDLLWIIVMTVLSYLFNIYLALKTFALDSQANEQQTSSENFEKYWNKAVKMEPRVQVKIKREGYFIDTIERFEPFSYSHWIDVSEYPKVEFSKNHMNITVFNFEIEPGDKFTRKAYEKYCKTKSTDPNKDIEIKRSVLLGYDDKTYQVQMLEENTNSIGFRDESFKTPWYFKRCFILFLRILCVGSLPLVLISNRTKKHVFTIRKKIFISQHPPFSPSENIDNVC